MMDSERPTVSLAWTKLPRDTPGVMITGRMLIKAMFPQPGRLRRGTKGSQGGAELCLGKQEVCRPWKPAEGERLAPAGRRPGGARAWSRSSPCCLRGGRCRLAGDSRQEAGNSLRETADGLLDSAGPAAPAHFTYTTGLFSCPLKSI